MKRVMVDCQSGDCLVNFEHQFQDEQINETMDAVCPACKKTTYIEVELLPVATSQWEGDA